jgi:hypothetical protein
MQSGCYLPLFWRNPSHLSSGQKRNIYPTTRRHSLQDSNREPQISRCGRNYITRSLQLLYISMALQLFVGPWLLLNFLISLHSRYDSLDRGTARRKTSTYTQNKCTQTSMPRVGFEPMIPVFERAKKVHALDRAATVIGFIMTLMNLKDTHEWNFHKNKDRRPFGCSLHSHMWFHSYDYFRKQGRM